MKEAIFIVFCVAVVGVVVFLLNSFGSATMSITEHDKTHAWCYTAMVNSSASISCVAK